MGQEAKLHNRLLGMPSIFKNAVHSAFQYMAVALPLSPGNIILHKVAMAKQHSEPFIPMVCVHVEYVLLCSLL